MTGIKMKTENIAYASITKYCEQGHRDKEIITWIHNDLTETQYSYGYFELESNKIAQVLQNLGIVQGDVVGIYLPRSPISLSAFFAIQKGMAMSFVLFSTLGEEALFDRLEDSQAKIVITKKSLARKILAIKDKLPHLEKLLITDIEDHSDDVMLSLPKLMQDTNGSFSYPHFLDAETPSFLQYTSGSTGKPKGVLHVHIALQDIIKSFNEILKPTAADLYWCTADPAWITGLSYGVIAPLATMTPSIQYSGTYNASRWLQILKEKRVAIWYTAPTALRMLMQEDEKLFNIIRSNNLKRVYSVGEPLNPEIYHWGKKVFNAEIYDNWFQSETGSIMISNRPGLTVKPGSMGKPRSDIKVEIVDDDMNPCPIGVQGRLTLKKGWHSMFRTFIHQDDAYQDKFNGEHYITGDLAYEDTDGYFWYISRADDVINTAGHLIGPFEVESALLEIKEIGEAAVIGVDDPILYKKIIAFIVLPTDVIWDKALELKCRVYVSNKVSTVAIPAEFVIIEKIPKNQSGKILRRYLRAIYEGTDPGDVSTME